MTNRFFGWLKNLAGVKFNFASPDIISPIMSREVLRDSLYDELKEGLAYSGGEIRIDDPQRVLISDINFCPVVTELAKNCLDKGATRVTVTVRWGRIVVEDNVTHTTDELKAILANITKPRPRTTKEPDPEFGHPIGGAGIFSVRKTLAGYDGELCYKVTEDNRIKAIATWPTARS